MQHKAGLILICEDCPCCIARMQQALAWLMTKLISFKHWLLWRPWLLDTRNVHFINRDCRLHPTSCQATVSTSIMSGWADWRERFPKCGISTRVSFHYRACHRLSWQDSTDAHYKRTSLPSFGSIASVCARCIGIWKWQRSCFQLWRFRCNHDAFTASSRYYWYPFEFAKGHVQHQTDTMVICLHAIKVFCIRWQNEEREANMKGNLLMLIFCWYESHSSAAQHSP